MYSCKKLYKMYSNELHLNLSLATSTLICVFQSNMRQLTDLLISPSWDITAELPVPHKDKVHQQRNNGNN